MDVLVGYATAHGSTHGVAEQLAAGVGRAGLKADVRPLETVDDAYVLGSAVHNQTWLDPAKAFLRGNADLLGTRPVWIFSVGMPGHCAGRGSGWRPWRRR